MAARRLKKGFTTGAAAAAAVKAALTALFSGQAPEEVTITFLTGQTRVIPVHNLSMASRSQCSATIIKDAGDDPDITHGAEIGARVTLKQITKPVQISIHGGQGIGRITKPGLELPVGEAAINPGPRTMIENEAREILKAFGVSRKHIEIILFAPEGETLARKTLNARLGILGGISILGTTGVVTPMSHEAYIATIRAGIDVAAAGKAETLVFTTGRRSERFAMTLFGEYPKEAFIQTGDFFKAALEAAVQRKEINTIVYAVFFGKAVKMALGHAHTHAARSELTLDTLAEWARRVTGEQDLALKISNSNTARHAFSYIYPDYPGLLTHVAEQMIQSAMRFSDNRLGFRVVIFDFDGNVACDLL